MAEGRVGGTFFPFVEEELGRRVAALAAHNPPRLIWTDPAGEMRFRCETDEQNPDCAGCRETGTPGDPCYRFDPAATQA